jgi:hypothetical protein
MQYILSEEEMSNLVPKSEFTLMTENFHLALKAFQESGKCRPHLGECDECPLCSINIKRPRICDKQKLSQ